MNELPAAIFTACVLLLCGNVYYAMWRAMMPRGYRRLTRLEMFLEKKKHEFSQYDIERLVEWSLFAVTVVWFLWVMVFK